jgi:hypothetical protein
MAIDDGSANAPAGTPQLPNLLSSYASRPSWEVAGVDYAVGVNPGVAIKAPTAGNLPSGASLSGNAIYVNGTNVTLDGYDLTNMTVMVNNSARGTVTISTL